ncbi:MAG: hypothetical protein KA007_02745 [Candidatus Pacebacteria bacterium]|nr:hypothetical protein [Candidatus Paceibacterota bacterium]
MNKCELRGLSKRLIANFGWFAKILISCTSFILGNGLVLIGERVKFIF